MPRGGARGGRDNEEDEVLERPLLGGGGRGLARPLAALALPGMYLVYKFHQYRSQRRETVKKNSTEKELEALHTKIDKLLDKLEDHELEVATTQEDECVICVSSKATMQTYPCAHRVVCRKCFVKTIQVAVSQRMLPLRCIICRTKILRLKHGFPSSASAYSVPSSASLYSVTSSSSGLSSLSSGSSISASSYGCKPRRPSNSPASRSTPSIASAHKSRKNSRSPSPSPSIESNPRATRPRARSSTPSNERLPPIQEFQREFRASKKRASTRTSTRIRCTQKLIQQLEKQSDGRSKGNLASGQTGSHVNIAVYQRASSAEIPLPPPPRAEKQTSSVTDDKKSKKDKKKNKNQSKH